MDPSHYNRIQNGHTRTDAEMDRLFEEANLEALYQFIIPGRVEIPTYLFWPEEFTNVTKKTQEDLVSSLGILEQLIRRTDLSEDDITLILTRKYPPFLTGTKQPFAANSCLEIGYDNHFIIYHILNYMGAQALVGLAVGYRDKGTQEVKALVGIAKTEQVIEAVPTQFKSAGEQARNVIGGYIGKVRRAWSGIL